MTISAPPGLALSPEQWRLVEALSYSLGPMEACWLSGYFAGLDAGLRQPPSQSAPSFVSATRKLAILYGTETGNAAEVAHALQAATKTAGFEPELFDMADYKVRKLVEEQDLLVVVSTYGEGERRRQKLEPAYQFMIRVRLPGGVCTPAQWLKLDELARAHGGETLRITAPSSSRTDGST